MNWLGLGGLLGGMQAGYSGMQRQQEFLNQQHLQAMASFYQSQIYQSQAFPGAFVGFVEPSQAGTNCINCGAPRNASGCSYCGTK